MAAEQQQRHVASDDHRQQAVLWPADVCEVPDPLLGVSGENACRSSAVRARMCMLSSVHGMRAPRVCAC